MPQAFICRDQNDHTKAEIFVDGCWVATVPMQDLEILVEDYKKNVAKYEARKKRGEVWLED